MAPLAKRSTIYLDADLYQVLRQISDETNRPIPELANDLLRAALLQEDLGDLNAFEERAFEPVISYEKLVAKLKIEGKI